MQKVLGDENRVEITVAELLDRILCSDIRELNEIIDAVEERFQELLPDWELLVIRCEGHTPQLHIQTLQQCIQVLSGADNMILP